MMYKASGKPYIALHGGAGARAKLLNIEHIHLSLTDDEDVAMAFAVAEGL